MKGFIALLAVVLIIVACDSNQSDNQEVSDAKKILIVYSGHQKSPWVQSIEEGLSEVLMGKPFEVKRMYMDVIRNPAPDFKVYVTQQILDFYNEYHPHIVLTVDDEAREFFSSKLIGRKNIALVYCSLEDTVTVNRNVRLGKKGFYISRAKNETGILKRPNLKLIMQSLRGMHDDLDTLSVLTDETPESDAFLRHLDYYSKSLSIRLNKVVSTSDLFEWEKVVSNPEADALLVYSYKGMRDEKFEKVDADEVISWTAEISKVPTIAFDERAVRKGCLIAFVQSGIEQGRLAGDVCISIMQGKHPQKIAIKAGQKGHFVVNRHTAERLDVNMEHIKQFIQTQY